MRAPEEIELSKGAGNRFEALEALTGQKAMCHDGAAELGYAVSYLRKWP